MTRLALVLAGMALVIGDYKDESGDTLRLLNPPVIEAEIVKDDNLAIHDDEVYEIKPEEVEVEVEQEAEVPAENVRLWGTATITFYCPCSRCCGQWAGGATASGVMPTPNHTVACGDLPFGTHLIINGQEYVVEDTGVNGMWVDIFVSSHSEALNRGMYQAEVYIVE